MSTEVMEGSVSGYRLLINVYITLQLIYLNENIHQNEMECTHHTGMNTRPIPIDCAVDIYTVLMCINIQLYL